LPSRYQDLPCISASRIIYLDAVDAVVIERFIAR